MKKRNVEFEKCKILIESCCFDIKKINWGIEVRMAKKLLKLFPDIIFWRTLYLEYKPSSLMSLLGKSELRDLEVEYKKFQLTQIDELKEDLQKEKVGEPYLSLQGNKTTKEFLQ